MSDFFDMNMELQMEQLIARPHRTSKWLDLDFGIVYPLQWLRDLIFDDYKKGAPYAFYSGGVTYIPGDRTVAKNDSVYECIATTLGNSPMDVTSPTYWVRVVDNYIGLDERIKYNSQFIVMGYSINKKFRVAASPYIYFDVDNTTPGGTLTIMVPSAVFSTLGISTAERKKSITDFVDQYITAGVQYAVASY